MDVCGIDPGLDLTGYAVIRMRGDGLMRGAVTVLDAGVFRTTRTDPLADRLVQLADDFAELLAQWPPQAVGVEQIYAHYRHPRTAIQMAHARGVLLATARRTGVTMHGFNATQIKRFTTGNGRASKTQMQQAIQAWLGLATLPEPPDVADALAAALCCAQALASPELEVTP